MVIYIARIDIEMKGIEKAIKGIKAYEKRKIEAIKKSVAKTTLNIENQAKAMAPVDEGNLKNSISSQFYKDGLTGEVSVGAEYGPYVEFGHKTRSGSHVPAQPYLMPSYDTHKKKFIDDVNKIVKEG